MGPTTIMGRGQSYKIMILHPLPPTLWQSPGEGETLRCPKKHSEKKVHIYKLAELLRREQYLNKKRVYYLKCTGRETICQII